MSDSSGGNSVTQISSQNIFQRIGSAILGTVFGVLLFFVAIGVLAWNESRAVDAIRGLGQAAHDVVEAQPSPVDPAQNQHLIHLSGDLATKDKLSDPEMGLAQDNAVRLKRTVEMYQWKEKKETSSSTSVGGTETTHTTYSYSKVWSEDPIDSGEFKQGESHTNPDMPIRTQTFNNAGVTLGDRKLSNELVAELDDFSTIPPPQTAPDGYVRENGRLYKGEDPDKPRVGDIRIGFSDVPAQTVSIMAEQRGSLLTPFKTTNGYKIGLVSPGEESAEEMVAEKRAEEKMLTWILRVVGFFCFFFSLLLITGPLETLASVLPFLGSIVGGGMFIFALGLSIPLTLVTIALAWIVVRPLLGIGLLVVAGLLVYAYHRFRPRRTVAARLTSAEGVHRANAILAFSGRGVGASPI